MDVYLTIYTHYIFDLNTVTMSASKFLRVGQLVTELRAALGKLAGKTASAPMTWLSAGATGGTRCLLLIARALFVGVVGHQPWPVGGGVPPQVPSTHPLFDENCHGRAQALTCTSDSQLR